MTDIHWRQCVQCNKLAEYLVDEVCKKCWISYPSLAAQAAEQNKRFNQRLNLVTPPSTPIKEIEHIECQVCKEEKEGPKVSEWTYLGIGLIIIILGFVTLIINKG